MTGITTNMRELNEVIGNFRIACRMIQGKETITSGDVLRLRAMQQRVEVTTLAAIDRINGLNLSGHAGAAAENVKTRLRANIREAEQGFLLCQRKSLIQDTATRKATTIRDVMGTITSFVPVSSLPALARINRACRISTRSAIAKAEKKYGPILTELRGQTGLTYRNLIAYQQRLDLQTPQEVLKYSPGAIHLDFKGCDFLSRDALISLARACPRLERLELDGCMQITDEDLMAISRNHPGLREITLLNCPRITEQGVATFAQNCPRLIRIPDLGRPAPAPAAAPVVTMQDYFAARDQAERDGDMQRAHGLDMQLAYQGFPSAEQMVPPAFQYY
jgi:hypothetical protein